MANSINKQKSATGSSKSHIEQVKEWYSKTLSEREKQMFERAQDALQLLDPTKTYTKTFTTFSKDKLRSYMKNPLTNYKNLRSLSRFLYYRSQVYRRIINYNATMIDLKYRSVIPRVDLVKGSDKQKVLKNYYETLQTLDYMNLPLEFLKLYIINWREDISFGCAYFDDEAFFILPLDPDYCKVTSIYGDGSLGFDFDMTYFSRRQEILEMWGEPFTSMWNEYQKDTTNGRWQPIPDENCICLKVNIDDWETPLPPYMGIFANLINLEDLSEITAVADAQQIYKLLVATIPTINNTNNVNDFAVDPDVAIQYFDRMKETLPDYTDAIISPIPVESVTFDQDAASDVNKLENATKAILNTSGGAQVLNSSSISGTTAWTGAIIADQEYALSSLLPQTEAIVNRLLSYKLSDPCMVRFLKVTEQTKKAFKDSITKDATYGLPTKLMMNTLNGLNELDTIGLNFLEEDCLQLSQKFVPLQSSNTMNTGDLANPEGGRPTADEKGEARTDDGESSENKRDGKK